MKGRFEGICGAFINELIIAIASFFFSSSPAPIGCNFRVSVNEAVTFDCAWWYLYFNMSEREEESKLLENLPALDALPVEEVDS